MAKAQRTVPKKVEPAMVAQPEPNHTEKIKSQVLAKIGKPPRLLRVEVCKHHKGRYRVNIWEQPEPDNQGTQRECVAMSLIYDLVVATFLKLGLHAPTDVCETLLVDDGCFIGHRFRCGGGYAIWGVGWKAVEFYDEEGQLLKMVAIKKAERLPDECRSRARARHISGGTGTGGDENAGRSVP